MHLMAIYRQLFGPKGILRVDSRYPVLLFCHRKRGRALLVVTQGDAGQEITSGHGILEGRMERARADRERKGRAFMTVIIGIHTCIYHVYLFFTGGHVSPYTREQKNWIATNA
jgi:hypothetical protein